MDDAREAYWHEAEPRIIASGRWEQDELGDVTYIPDHVRPSTAEAAEADGPPVGGDAGPEAPNDVMGDVMGDPTGDTGYRVRSEQTWAAARRDYLAGDPAEAVCARYDLKLGTLRSRAAREGWRRSDAPDNWPDPQDENAEAPASPPDLAQMAAQALMRLNRALQRGRAVEAASWLRTWRALTDPTLLAASIPASAPGPEPDPAATLDADLKAVAEVARDAARLSPDDHAGRRAIETRMAALKTRLDPEGRISDVSDELDSVFSTDPP